MIIRKIVKVKLLSVYFDLVSGLIIVKKRSDKWSEYYHWL